MSSGPDKRLSTKHAVNTYSFFSLSVTVSYSLLRDCDVCTSRVSHGCMSDRPPACTRQAKETAAQLSRSQHFQREEVAERTEHVVRRFTSLAEPLQIRRDNLEQATQLHQFIRCVNIVGRRLSRFSYLLIAFIFACRSLWKFRF